MNKIYYDTNVFWRFFQIFIEDIPLPGKVGKFSPLEQNNNYIKITAPWTLDEFFHSYIVEKRNEIKFPIFKNIQIKNRIENLSRINEYMALFHQEIIDTRDVNILFITLFLLARDKNILNLKQNDEKLDSKDLLHLSYALVSKCNIFITSDKKFELLNKIVETKKILLSLNLSRIIIVKDNLSDIEKEILFL